MAAVRAVGARVALASPREGQGLELQYWLFAELQNGDRIQADNGPLIGRFPEEQPGDRAELEHYVRIGFRHPGLQRAHREAFWGGLVRSLRSQGVETDEETLLALPFEVELDQEVERLFPA
jgi:hypothetical protein